jgi:hypothetical protein
MENSNLDAASLREVKQWLLDRVFEGETCPCCGQFAKVYRRKINSTQARALVIIYRECGTEWGHLPTLRMHLAPHHSNEEPKLRYWDLIEEESVVRPDGGRAGWWRVTPEGEQWVRGLSRVAKYALIYNGECIRLDSVQTVSVQESLGDRFDYTELMNGS